MSECNVRLFLFRRLLFGMSPDVPAFEVRFLTNDFKCLIGVKEYQ